MCQVARVLRIFINFADIAMAFCFYLARACACTSRKVFAPNIYRYMWYVRFCKNLNRFTFEFSGRTQFQNESVIPFFDNIKNTHLLWNSDGKFTRWKIRENAGQVLKFGSAAVSARLSRWKTVLGKWKCASTQSIRNIKANIRIKARMSICNINFNVLRSNKYV